MSQTYRLYGLEFTPTRLDLKIPMCEQTGFEVGCAIGFNRGGKSVRERNILEQMGVVFESETAVQLEEEIKYGNVELSDYLRDVLAGYEHAKTHMKLATDACVKLSHCLYFLGRHRADVQFVFPSELLERFSGTDFMVKQADGVVVKSSVAFSHPLNISSGVLLVGPDQVELGIDPDMEYNQDSCRAVHNYIGTIVDTLYLSMEGVMAAEQREIVIRKIREDVESKAKTATQYCSTNPELAPEIPNFYLKRE